MSGLQIAPRGRLKVSAPVTFGTRYVAPTISDYLSGYPDVTVDLVLDDRPVDLVGDSFDLAIRFGELADSSFMTRRLGGTRMVLCASPSYLASNGMPGSVHELANRECLTYAHAPDRSRWDFIGSDGGEEVVRVTGRLRANNGDALRLLAIDGHGIALLPNFIVNDDLCTGRLVALMAEHRLVDLPIQVIYPHSRFVPAKVRKFIACLATRLMRAARPTSQPDGPVPREPVPRPCAA